MKRLIVAIGVGGALFAVVAFAAASLSLNAGNLSQAGATITDCAEGSTVDLDWNTGGSNPVNVTDVDVNVPGTAACNGATATVEVFDLTPTVFKTAASCVISARTCNADISNTDVDLVDYARVTLTGP